jgi:phenylalanyl-tRNA synthetase beta chain
LQYYRQTLTPSLLGLVHQNIRQGYDDFAIFEVNKTHQKQDGLTEENVPVESDMLALIVASKNIQIGAPYFRAKRFLDYLSRSFGLDADYIAIDTESNDAVSAPFEYRHSAKIVDKSSGILVGLVGEYRKSVSKNYKLSDNVAGFEVNLRSLFEIVKNVSNDYSPISRYPGSERDICFQVTKDASYKQIIVTLESALQNITIASSIEPVDIYQPDDGQTKNITVRIKLTSHDHTLTGDEVTSIVDSLTSSVVTEIKATVI